MYCDLFLFLPGNRREQQKNREQFKSSRKHIENKRKLGYVREAAEIACRTYYIKSRTYVVQTGCNCREVCGKIVVVKGNDKQGKDEHHYKTNDIYVYRAYNLMFNRTFINDNFFDLLGMNKILKLLAHTLEKNDDS